LAMQVVPQDLEERMKFVPAINRSPVVPSDYASMYL